MAKEVVHVPKIISMQAERSDDGGLGLQSEGRPIHTGISVRLQMFDMEPETPLMDRNPNFLAYHLH